MIDTMIDTSVSISEEEFNELFYKALYSFDGTNLFFRKAKHGNSFIRANS